MRTKLEAAGAAEDMVELFGADLQRQGLESSLQERKTTTFLKSDTVLVGGAVTVNSALEGEGEENEKAF